jgi:hypothetical protein
MIRNLTGQPAQGENFFGREGERKKVWSALETEHLLLLAPRRVGKTSLLYSLRDGAKTQGFIPVYADVSGLTSELAFVERLYSAVVGTPEAGALLGPLQKGRVRHLFKGIRSLKVWEVELVFQDRLPGEWLALGEALFDGLRAQTVPWLVMVDELPLFVLSLLRQDPTGARARAFLEWFRRIRQGTPGEVYPLRWVLAGSIGLDTVTRRLELGDTINDLKLFELGPFSPETADHFLEELGKSYGLALTPEVRAAICSRSGWLIPYYLQLIFSGLREHCGDTGAAPTPALVDQVFEELLSPGHRAYFDFWIQRLPQVLGPPQDGYAVELLTACASDPTGVARPNLEQVLGRLMASPETRDKELNWLIDVLIGDGYLVEQRGRYPFRSNLLREFWLRRFPQ